MYFQEQALERESLRSELKKKQYRLIVIIQWLNKEQIPFLSRPKFVVRDNCFPPYYWHFSPQSNNRSQSHRLPTFLRKRKQTKSEQTIKNVICQIENLDKVGHVTTNKKLQPGSFLVSLPGGPWIDNADTSSISRSIVYPLNDSSSSVGMYIGFLRCIISLWG